MWKILIGIVCAVIVFCAVIYFLTPRGSVTGEFVSAEHRGFGDFCGQYPFTSIVLKDYSVDGDIDDWDNRFRFGNQYSNVDNLKPGQRIKINYHQESRGSDTTSGDTIYYWVIDNICLLYTSPSPRDRQRSRMPSSA